ncbi:Sulphur transport [Ruegeria intermedia]|uniref:Sulphur transport n=1 Tax=Ruegeria intermedia TaxID=996115 RepID=A0A1M4W0V3_9RHOB|nr:YeeE/YedE family protein [Ruegeria intermedia]SHE74846.1 Sulphur transport [Ruegeria intermedia]
MEQLIDQFGEPRLLVFSGAVVGLLFGAAAGHSRFCLRAATVEVAERRFGPKLAIWLVAFSAALALVQLAIVTGHLDVSSARQIAGTGSLSGAVFGGLMFGVGMILARGCASRLLVLSASGNLRTIVTGLVLTLTAQAAYRGVLAPAREMLAGLWTVPGGPDRLLAEASLPLGLAAASALIVALIFGRIRGARPTELFAAALVGAAVFLGWIVTHAIAAASFEVVQVQSVTFTGPSADTLMALVNERSLPMSFGLGLVPGVFVGALGVALLKGEARIQRFGADTPMERYLVGGVLMGFGSMLAGGCAVGAGLSGGAILALTAWVAVFCMWIGAVATHSLLDLRWRRAAAT